MSDILVIDDYQPFCAFIADALNDGGYTVQTVDTPEDTYATLERRTPDLILCERYIKGVSGLDLITVLRRHGMAAAAPVVIMTTDTSCLQTDMPQGIAGYLVKPFELDDLYTCIENHRRDKAGLARQRSGSLQNN